MSTAETVVPFFGLAPFLRQSIAGKDLRPAAQALLAQAEAEPDNPDLWMNLATAFLSLGQSEVGLNIQRQALQMQRLYKIPAVVEPPSARVLVLMAEGDIADNTPLDCLLESGPVELLLYYASSEQPLPEPMPEHDVVFVAIAETAKSGRLLNALAPLLSKATRPVINAPQYVLNTERSAASRLLRDIPGVLMPPTHVASRRHLQACIREDRPVGQLFSGCEFPIILRPQGSHAGRGLAKLENWADVEAYLAEVEGEGFFISRFVDYSGADGQYRKFRLALIDGKAYPCHLAVSSNWMIHYLNAGMYEDAAKREQEAAFMAGFDAFVDRHGAALEEIQRRTQLAYLCIDGAETRDGQLLIFEIDHAMVVHAMDPQDLFPYKQPQMLRVRHAFEAYLGRLIASSTMPAHDA